MRLHLMLNGKRTTISVDEQLFEYLKDRVCKGNSFIRAIGAKDEARKWIQKTVDRAGDAMPSKNVSQWVQARIVDAIVDPALLEMRANGTAELALQKARYGDA